MTKLINKKTIKYRAWLIILIVVIAILLLLLIRSCKKNVDYSNDVKEIAGYKDAVAYYKSKSGDLIASNESLNISYKALTSINSGLEKELKNLRLKKPSSITSVRSELRVDTVAIPFKDTLPCDDFTKTFPVDSPYYNMYVSITKKLLSFYDVVVIDTQRIIVAKKKGTLFKKGKSIVTVKHSNPFMYTVGLKNYTIKQKQNKINFGPSLSYGITLPGLKPELVLGVSIQYNLFGF